MSTREAKVRALRDLVGRLQMRPGQVWENVGGYQSAAGNRPGRLLPARQLVLGDIVQRPRGYPLARITPVDPDPRRDPGRFVDSFALSLKFTLVDEPGGQPACRVCGCRDDSACPDTCWWVPDPVGVGALCSCCEEFARLDTRPVLADLARATTA